MHASLHASGAAHYMHGAAATAVACEALTAAVFFGSGAAAARSGRLLAAVLMHDGQSARAAEYAQLAAEKHGAPCALGCLLRLGAHLQLLGKRGAQGDGNAVCSDAPPALSAAAAALSDLVHCTDVQGKELQVRMYSRLPHPKTLYAVCLICRSIMWLPGHVQLCQVPPITAHIHLHAPQHTVADVGRECCV